MTTLEKPEIAFQVRRILRDLGRSTKSARCGELEHENHHKDLCNNLERLKLWAGGIGALHGCSDPRSLEHRLRQAPNIKARIYDLLESLTENINQGAQNLNLDMHRIYLIAAAVLHYGSDQGETSPVEHHGDMKVTQDDLELLDMLGITKGDEDKHACRLLRICDKIAKDISYLFKASSLIGKAITRDRYARAEIASREIFESRYDIMYVQEKTRDRQGRAGRWLVNRLGEAITKRRQYLKYVREHDIRLQQMSEQPHDSPPRGDNAPPSELPKAATLSPHTAYNPSVPSTLQRMTTASTVSPGTGLQEETLEDNRTQITATDTAGIRGASHALSTPLLSDYGRPGEEFQCPFCRKPQMFEDPNQWGSVKANH